MWEDWWRGHGASVGEPWKAEDTGPWTDVPGFRNWKTWGVPELANLDGMVWYRRTFNLTPAQAAGPATLSLGGIDEVDETWVNGRVIRNTFGWGNRRTYRLPAGTLRAGDNVVVVNVLSTYDAGGMIGPEEAVELTCGDGTKLPLAGNWRYRAVPLSAGRPPRAPWETIAGLTTLYNGMIAPIGPFGLRGVLWYQGESNADDPTGYEKLLRGLMASWRSQFGDDLPFLIVQLPNFGAVPTKPVESGWADIREAQRRAVAADGHAGLAVTIDIGEPGDHPSRPTSSTSAGAWCARRATSSTASRSRRRDRLPSPPAGSRLASSSRSATWSAASSATAPTWSSGSSCAAPAAGSCRFAAGTIDGTRVVLPVPASGQAPARVRFCWGASPLCNLSDGSGLPVGPFEIPIK